MALESSTLGPSGQGYDYTTMQTWESAAQGAHIAGNDTELLCAGFVLADNVSISGWVTQAGETLTIKPEVGAEHNGIPRANGGTGFRVEDGDPNPTYVIRIDSALDNVVIQGIEVAATATAAASCNPIANGSATRNSTHINEVIAFSEKASCLGFLGGTIQDLTVTNCLLVHTGTERCLDARSGIVLTTIENNTADNTGGDYGFWTWSNALLNNNTSKATTPYNINTVEAGSSNNASSNGSSVGTAQILNVSYADGDNFVSPSTNDYNLVSGGVDGLDGGGTSPPINATDIAGNTRPDPDDVGAYAIPAAALTFTLSPLSSPLPAGLSVNATTGNIEGTPTESGTFPNIIIRGTE